MGAVLHHAVRAAEEFHEHDASEESADVGPEGDATFAGSEAAQLASQQLSHLPIDPHRAVDDSSEIPAAHDDLVIALALAGG